MRTSITAFGESKTVLDWTHDARCVVSLMTLLKRIREGWNAEEAITTPSRAAADRYRAPIEAFGEKKPPEEWLKDPRTRCSLDALFARMRSGWDAERALTTPVEERTRKRHPKSKLYAGKTVSEWLRDPRCTVSRFTLERNLRANMPVEEALGFRKRRRAPSEDPTIDSVEDALEKLEEGGELWHYKSDGHSRTSILSKDTRYALEYAMFEELLKSGRLHAIYSGLGMTQYRLAKRSR